MASSTKSKSNPSTHVLRLEGYFRALAEDRFPSPEQIDAFSQSGMTARDAEGNVVRLRNVEDLRWQAGTTEEREASLADLQKAQEIERNEGNEIMRQMTALQDQLDALKRTTDQAKAKVEKQKTAVLKLRRCYPPAFDAELATIATLRNAGGVASRKRKLEAEIKDRKHRLTNDSEALEYLGGTLTQMGKVGINGAANIARLGHCQPGTENHDQALSFFKAHWDEYRQILTTELKALQDELDIVNDEYDRNYLPYAERKQEIIDWYLPRAEGQADPYDDAL